MSYAVRCSPLVRNRYRQATRMLQEHLDGRLASAATEMLRAHLAHLPTVRSRIGGSHPHRGPPRPGTHRPVTFLISPGGIRAAPEEFARRLTDEAERGRRPRRARIRDPDLSGR
jgi:hypothetical protein